MTQHRYVPLVRPASFTTLPRGVSWGYVEAPAMPGLTRQTDLPLSRHRYGVIATDRAPVSGIGARPSIQSATDRSGTIL